MIKSQGPQISPALNNLGNNFLRTYTPSRGRMVGNDKTERQGNLGTAIQDGASQRGTGRGQLAKIMNPKLGKPSAQPQNKPLEWLIWKEEEEQKSLDLWSIKIEKAQRIIVEYQTEHLAKQWQQMVTWRTLGKEVWLHVDLAKTTSTEFNYLWQEGNRLGISLIVDNLAKIMTISHEIKDSQGSKGETMEGETMDGKKRGHKQQNTGFKELLTTWAEAPWVQQKLYPWELLVENFLLQQSLTMGGKETKVSLNTENSKEFFPWKNKKIAKKIVQKMFEQWNETYPIDKLTAMLTGNNDKR